MRAGFTENRHRTRRRLPHAGECRLRVDRTAGSRPGLLTRSGGGDRAVHGTRCTFTTSEVDDRCQSCRCAVAAQPVPSTHYSAVGPEGNGRYPLTRLPPTTGHAIRPGVTSLFTESVDVGSGVRSVDTLSRDTTRRADLPPCPHLRPPGPRRPMNVRSGNLPDAFTTSPPPSRYVHRRRDGDGSTPGASAQAVPIRDHARQNVTVPGGCQTPDEPFS